ncbi:MAG: hypothetical protein JRN51_05125 [Nitrososphaerota archaeon]|nr:hypothetical protein [Nitrososphaerota archaeon]
MSPVRRTPSRYTSTAEPPTSTGLAPRFGRAEVSKAMNLTFRSVGSSVWRMTLFAVL